jgi:hypothetical protein
MVEIDQACVIWGETPVDSLPAVVKIFVVNGSGYYHYDLHLKRKSTSITSTVCFINL